MQSEWNSLYSEIASNVALAIILQLLLENDTVEPAPLRASKKMHLTP